jgi:acetyl esterase/lipase
MIRMVYGILPVVLMCTIAGAADFEKHSRIVYTTPNGESIKLSLWEPVDYGAALRPAIVLIHGGGWLMGTRMQVRTYGQEFAKRGYVVASIDYRTMPDYAFPYCVHDAKAAVRWLRLNADKYRIDPNRIATMGESAGGHIAGMLATTTPEDGFEGEENPGPSSEVQAAVLVYPALDFTSWGEKTQEKQPFWARGIANYFEEFITREQQDVDNPFERASPMTYADADTCPTLLIHGSKDILVDVKQSRAMFEKLSDEGVPSQIMIFEGVNHGFDHFSPTLRKKIIEAVVTFLDEHLPPGMEAGATP